MFKRLILSIAILMIAAVPALAVDPTTSTTASQYAGDFVYVRSNMGWGNDFAMAGGFGGAVANTTNTGASTLGNATAGAGTSAYGVAIDTGRSSFTAAGAQTTAFGIASGQATGSGTYYYGGVNGDPGWYIKDKLPPTNPQYGRIQYFPGGQSPNPNSEWNFLGSNMGGGPAASSSNVTVYGAAFQANAAKEVGYPSGTSAVAGNVSGGAFYGTANNTVKGTGTVNSEAALSGTVKTNGFSAASVDPYGNNQSAFAATGNATQVSHTGNPTTFQSGVFGAGGQATAAQNGAASATGGGSFTYYGTTAGAGYSTSLSTVKSTPTSFSASSSGFTATSSY
jgi:hypothetical protein